MKKGFSVLAAVAGCMIATASFAADTSDVFLVRSDGKVLKYDEMSHAPKKSTSVHTHRGTGITFEIFYADDGTNAGFDDPTHGASRKQVLLDVLDYIDGVLNHPSGTLQIEVDTSINVNSPTLAFAGAYVVGTPGYKGGFAFDHITSGTDPHPTADDMVVTVNFFHNWNNDSGTTASGEYDLYSVLLHEVTHALGVSSYADSTGASEIGANCYSFYDDLMRTGADARVFSAGGSPTYQGASFTGGNNTLKFSGADATTMLGGPVYLYTPVSYQSGSSVSHWQGTLPGSAVMHPTIGTGSANERRTYHDFEQHVLADLGYTLTNPPASVKDWHLID